MKNIIRSTSLLALLVAATLLTGCGSMGGPYGGGPTTTDRSGTYDPYEQSLDNVRGTVERIDTRAQTIVVTPESTGYRNDLRNGNDQIVLAYDSRTTVEFQGRTFRPEDLEPGDRILAEVASSSRSYDRPLVDQIQVLYDVSSGASDNGGYNTGGYNDRYSTNLRGIVNYVDTRNRTIEVDTSARGFSSGGSTTGRSGVVTVYYDSSTIVEFQGRRYQPENLERGDEVEIDTRDTSGGRLLANQITVVNDARSR